MENNLDRESKYVNIEDLDLSWYFNIEGIKMSDEEMKYIKPLAKAYSSKMWEKYISHRHHHFEQLDSEDKLPPLAKMDYNWLDDVDNGIYEDFSNYLLRSINYNQQDTVLAFWLKDYAVETEWHFFIKHLSEFLFDQGVILINISSEQFLMFCSNGTLLKGINSLN
ncbi:DUF2947 family protein [Listeria welshimeri]|uniref:DUF2947 family protein n=1 Tax=Listeria welshimeri TaxID=1643 RepID=UPI001624DDC2|nr:DUF2947 family protein [Listeria welshimeri]MBC2199649.1 DUF2947 family protein [Listeria welshimeri]MBF2451440.1 DUF2947 family protein [Listeria welshimeri]